MLLGLYANARRTFKFSGRPSRCLVPKSSDLFPRAGEKFAARAFRRESRYSICWVNFNESPDPFAPWISTRCILHAFECIALTSCSASGSRRRRARLYLSSAFVAHYCACRPSPSKVLLFSIRGRIVPKRDRRKSVRVARDTERSETRGSE